jgi:retron-type reverse transcriptase
MHNRLNSFLEKYNILTKEQFGFRNGKCTEIASQTFIECIQEAFDEHFHVVGIFLDLTKAYDMLNHHILLDKLESYGVRGTLNLWFKSYLSHCTQFVEITRLDHNNFTQNRYLSTPRERSYSVPQGSTLGPILFLLYINYLHRHVQEAKMVLYADDTNILVADKDEHELKLKIVSLMKHLEIWFFNNELIINLEQRHVMSFHSSQCKTPF